MLQSRGGYTMRVLSPQLNPPRLRRPGKDPKGGYLYGADGQEKMKPPMGETDELKISRLNMLKKARKKD